jgi:hypothetical protein
MSRLVAQSSIILPFLFLASCSHKQADREACYAKAEAAATQAALACPGSWKDCPDRPHILAELKAAQERCP